MDLFITLSPEAIAKIKSSLTPATPEPSLFDKLIDTPTDESFVQKVADRLSYRAIAEYIDPSSIAEEFSARDIAEGMDPDYELLASYVDTGEIAANIDTNELCERMFRDSEDEIVKGLSEILLKRIIDSPQFRKALCDTFLERLTLAMSH
jgi:hypothetical protein